MKFSLAFAVALWVETRYP